MKLKLETTIDASQLVKNLDDLSRMELMRALLEQGTGLCVFNHETKSLDFADPDTVCYNGGCVQVDICKPTQD